MQQQQRSQTTWLGVLLLSSGHLAVDFFGTILSPALPAISQRMGLSLAMAGMALSIPSTIGAFMQPVAGMILDALGSRLSLVYLAVAWSAVFTSLIGIAPNFVILVTVATLGSLSISTYHPLGAVLINQQTREHRSLAMSIYSAAGTLGTAISPALVFPLTRLYGPPILTLLIIPGLLFSGALALSRKRWALPNIQVARKERFSWNQLANVLRPVMTLNIVSALRAWAHMAIVAYMAFYLPERGFSDWATGAAISLHIVTGALACIPAGLLADRVGIRSVFAGCLMLAGLFTAGIVLFDSWLLLWVCIILSGTFIHATFPLAIVLSQDLLPDHQGLAAGLSMGFSFGLGALALPLTGLVGDVYGLAWTFLGSALILLLSAMLVPSIRQAAKKDIGLETIR